MTIKFNIAGTGDFNIAKVSDEGALHVISHVHPPTDEAISSIPYRSFFTNTAGSSDMLVDGSTTAQQFTITANATKDTYVKTISFVIADGGAVLNKFGNIPALTNGCSLVWSTQDLGETVIADNLVSNFEFIRLALGNPTFGTGTAAFRASNVSGSSEAFIPVLDLENTFGIKHGLRLRAGTNDKIIITINDDVSAIDQFDAIAYGLKI